MMLILANSGAFAETLSGRSIMERNDAAQVSRYETSTLTMTLVNENNRQRERKLIQKIMHTEDGSRKRYIYFEKPGDVKGTKLLTLENKGAEDTQWIFLPAIKRARQISVANNTDSFVGSELSFEDLRREKLDEHRYVLLNEETVDGKSCYVVEATPSTEKRKAESGYSRRMIWIQKDTFLALKTHFFDKHSKLLKTFHAEDIRQFPSGDSRAFKFHLENVQNHHRTILEFNNISLEEEINKSIFSIRSLR